MTSSSLRTSKPGGDHGPDMRLARLEGAALALSMDDNQRAGQLLALALRDLGQLGYSEQAASTLRQVLQSWGES